jgi:UDP-glucose 4-epimerase
MRVLVTGAAGFMGSHLVDSLVGSGHEVFGVDDMSGGFWRNINPKSNFTQLDLRDQARADSFISNTKPELLFHLAADATEGRSQFTPVNCVQRNLMAYLNVLVPCIREGLKKVVLVSSMSVYGDQRPPFSEEMPRSPVDVYGVSKASMEHITEILSAVHSFNYTIIRPHNVYGERQNIADPYRTVVGIFINALLNDRHFFIYGDGAQKRAFTNIADFTPYLLRAGFDPMTDREIINVGPREEVTINHLAEMVLKVFFPQGVRVELIPVHLPDRPREVKEAFCTTHKAERLLGYRTTVDLETGLHRMAGWARELGPQQPRYLVDGLELVTDQVPLVWRNAANKPALVGQAL